MPDQVAEHPGVLHSVLELRQYTLHPGRRDTLITLFDREFIEPQEEVGMRVVGQFRDLDDPDRFVWIRSFPDMAARAESLAAFYGGPIWAAHRMRPTSRWSTRTTCCCCGPPPPVSR
jgi:hypothetical protein